MELDNWDDIIDNRTILAGDFNAYNPMWGSLETTNSAHIIRLTEDHDLLIANNFKFTRYGTDRQRPSIIDLTLSAGPRIDHWEIIQRDDHHSESDHRVIMWDTLDQYQRNANRDKKTSKIRTGWKIDDPDEDQLKADEAELLELSRDNPQLAEDCSDEEIELEAKWLETALTTTLDKNAKPISMCR
ncbi:hypothetical protein FPQ18DRAFT_396546 [Pyronema domesticum]|nr:hypothetical protein FPQ18DRAFT_396546 [Pyronema domesticum]